MNLDPCFLAGRARWDVWLIIHVVPSHFYFVPSLRTVAENCPFPGSF